MLSVFGDESHDETNSRVFAVAGLFGSEEQWDALNGKWLERTGGKVFHATDCDNDRGDFSGIDHKENKKLYKDLIVIICESKLLGFGSAIDLAGHKEFFPDAPGEIPYYRCFRDVVVQCGKWAVVSVPQDTVKFTFDSRLETNYNARVLYNFMVNLPEWRASSYLNDEISFSSRKTAGI